MCCHIPYPKQETVGDTTLDVTAISGLSKLFEEATCDHAIVMHIPHLCTLRYAHNIAEIAAGLAYTAALAKGEQVSGDTAKQVTDAVAAARCSAADKMELHLVDTITW